MLDINDFVQINSNGFFGSNGSASLPTSTGTGRTVLVLAATEGTSDLAMSGFVGNEVQSPTTTHRLYAFRKSNVGVESSWTITVTPTVSQLVSWVAIELDDLDLDSPKDQDAGIATVTGTSLACGFSGSTTTYDGVVLVLHSSYRNSSATPATFSGHSNSFEEVAEQSAVSGNTSLNLSVSRKFVQSIGNFNCTATASVSADLAGTILVYSGAGAKHSPRLEAFAGFEWGTATGIITGSSTLRLFDALAGAPTIVGTTPKSGDYCLELPNTGAAQWLAWNGGSAIDSALDVGIISYPFYFVGNLPNADVDLLTMPTAQGNAVLWYRAATQSLGLKIGTGTEVTSLTPVTADTWHSVDIRYDIRTAAFTGDWMLDLVEQPSATFTAAASSVLTAVRFGRTVTCNVPIRVDDVVLSEARPYLYPLEQWTVRRLIPDPADVVTVVGTASRFNVFSNNGGTVAAFDGTVARDALSEVPPSVGASANGAAQSANATSDYMQIPMSGFTAAPIGAVRGGRLIICGWAASTTASEIGVRIVSLGLESNLYPSGDPNFDNSSTPAWWAKFWRPAAGWTQEDLDTINVRLGYSADAANPIIGAQMVIVEAAIQIARQVTVFSIEDDLFQVDAMMDPSSSGVISYVVVTPATRGATFGATVNGVPITPIHVAANSDHEEVIAAEDFTAVSGVYLAPDPAV